jgi:hypothetical protein
MIRISLEIGNSPIARPPGGEGSMRLHGLPLGLV